MKPVFRIAPTPSGYLHIGNAMSFVYTAQLAKAMKADLLLRIDDMDSERTRPEYVQDIFDTLDFLNIQPTVGPTNANELATKYAQIHRSNLYDAALQQLINTGLAYACTCSRKTLEQQNGNCVCNGTSATLQDKDVALRIKVPPDTIINFTDVLLGSVSINLYQHNKNFVVRRREGVPAYQLTSVCDDIFFGVTHIVRGVDLLPSTAMQLYLATLLNYTPFLHTNFYHHPVLKNSNGEKMSKSAGAESIKELCKHKTAEELSVIIQQLLKENGLV